MSGISNAQFGALVGRLRDPEQGGFTVNPNTGSDVESGISVAPYGNERQIKAEETTGDDVRKYAVANTSRFRRGAALGGWTNEGVDYLDTPTVYPDEPSGHRGARTAMVQNRQLAGFDLGTFTEQPNVFHPEMRRQIGMGQHEIADAAMRNPQFALNQPEVQAWTQMPRRSWAALRDHAGTANP